MHMITDEMPRVYPRRYAHLILYAGNDLTFLKSLQESLTDCQISRSPTGLVSRTLIAGLKYGVIFIDEQLPDMTGHELATFARQLPRTDSTPVVIIKNSGKSIKA